MQVSGIPNPEVLVKKLAGLMAALVILGSLAAPAFGYPIDQPTCGVSPSQISPGDQVTVSGDNWDEGSTIRVILRPEQILLGTAVANANEHFSITVTIPDDLLPGRHKIVCKGRNVRGKPKVLGTEIVVLGETVAPPAGTAFTGATSNVPFWASLAGILALLGVTTLFAARRLRRRPSPD